MLAAWQMSCAHLLSRKTSAATLVREQRSPCRKIVCQTVSRQQPQTSSETLVVCGLRFSDAEMWCRIRQTAMLFGGLQALRPSHATSGPLRRSWPCSRRVASRVRGGTKAVKLAYVLAGSRGILSGKRIAFHSHERYWSGVQALDLHAKRCEAADYLTLWSPAAQQEI